MKHYTYKIIDPITNEFYFGSRSNENPKTDTYMGSYKVWNPKDKSRLIKEIIRDDFKTRQESIQHEAKLIKESINNKLNKNYYIPNDGFHVLGLKWKWNEKSKKKLSEKIIKNKSKSGTNNPMYNKNHTDKSIELMKTKSKNKYTLNWFIHHYGETEGKILYDKKREEHSKKISGKNHPRFDLKGKDNPLYGRSVSEDTKRKISKTKSKKIKQFSKDDIFIREWDSVSEAARYYSIHINSIYHNLKGRRSHSNGYIWKYT